VAGDKVQCNNRMCRHREFHDDHCAVMECPNYVNKCPLHRITKEETK